VFELRVLHFFVQAGHLRDESGHAIVPAFVSRVGEVDEIDWI
jgi:hypothetical protein